MGIFRMYTGDDGNSVIEELQVDDPILETLKTCSDCAIQINEPSEFSEFHPAPRRRWMSMLSGQIDIKLADGTIHSFGPNDLRLWEDVTGHGHKTRFPAPSVSISSRYLSIPPGEFLQAQNHTRGARNEHTLRYFRRCPLRGASVSPL